MSPRHSLQRGISLIEVLVGLAIGIVGVLAIFQTAAIWNRHAQTTSSGGDAQVAGTLALFDIERDFKQSGHGFAEARTPVMGCAVHVFDSHGAHPDFNLRPVEIVVGPAGTPDQINVLYGSSSFFVEGEEIVLSPTPTSKTLRRRGGFKMGDLVVVADAGGALPGSANCNLAEITSDTNPDLLTVDHTPTTYTSFYNPTPAASRFDAVAGIPLPAGTMFNLGPKPQLISWQIVSNRALQRSELIFDPTSPNAVGDGVINLKAEYGIDANNDTIIQPGEWLDTLPATSNWNQVLAIRVAILVRSRQFERSGDPAASAPAPVTTVAPTYFDGSASHVFAMGNVNGGADTFTGSPTTADPNNWRYYRYRVYERVIPLKNMLWALP